MHPLVQKWIEALLSNNYPQGNGCLRNHENKYCCLGVFCDISGRGKWLQNRGNVSFSFSLGEDEDMSRRLFSNIQLPTHLREEIGMSDPFMSALMGLNDQDKFTFSEIAYVVKYHWNDTDYVNKLSMRLYTERNNPVAPAPVDVAPSANSVV